MTFAKTAKISIFYKLVSHIPLLLQLFKHLNSCYLLQDLFKSKHKQFPFSQKPNP